MGFSGLAAWDEDLKVLLQDAPVAGARLLQRLLRPVNLALVVVVIDVELPGRGGVLGVLKPHILPRWRSETK